MIEGHPLRIVDLLVQRGIQLVIVGGHAVNFHGYLRATEDVDIVFLRTPETERLLLEVLNKVGAYWIGDEIDDETGIEETHAVTLDYIQQNHLMMLGSNVGWIDLFDFIPGMPDESLDDLMTNATVASGRPFASLDWLKRMKQAAGRPQDFVDLDHLPNS